MFVTELTREEILESVQLLPYYQWCDHRATNLAYQRHSKLFAQIEQVGRGVLNSRML